MAQERRVQGQLGVARADEEEDSDSRGTGNRKSGPTAPEEDGEVGGVWIVGNVMELDEEEEEGTGRPGRPSKYWARKDRSDRFGKIREEQRDGFSDVGGDQSDMFNEFVEDGKGGFVQ